MWVLSDLNDADATQKAPNTPYEEVDVWRGIHEQILEILELGTALCSSLSVQLSTLGSMEKCMLNH